MTELPTITSANTKISSVAGEHLAGKTIYDVERVGLRNKTKLQHFPNNLGSFFPNLTFIQLKYNSLKELNPENLQFMQKLEVLLLPGNQLSDLNAKLFDDVVNLKHLDLSGNRIKVLPNKLLARLKMLKRFEATDNLIEVIPNDFFNSNKVITEIYLNGNKLRKILVDFTKLKGLRKLQLLGNVCISKEFHQELDKIETQKEITLKCH